MLGCPQPAVVNLSLIFACPTKRRWSYTAVHDSVRYKRIVHLVDKSTQPPRGVGRIDCANRQPMHQRRASDVSRVANIAPANIGALLEELGVSLRQVLEAG